MGHGVSRAHTGDEHDFFRAVQLEDLDTMGVLLIADASLATLYDRLSRSTSLPPIGLLADSQAQRPLLAQSTSRLNSYKFSWSMTQRRKKKLATSSH